MRKIADWMFDKFFSCLGWFMVKTGIIGDFGSWYDE